MADERNLADNKAHPDGLDPMERKHLARGAFDEPDSDENNEFELESNPSLDEQELGHLETEEIFHIDHAEAVVDSQEDYVRYLTTHREKNNTGGKGVLEDFKEATSIKARRNETETLRKLEKWKEIGYGNEIVNTKNNVSDLKPKGSKDEDDDDSDDDEFFKKFRAQRIQQFSSVSKLPQFGRLQLVDKFEFVDIVDEAYSGTYVVIHVYEEYILACRRMNTILESLAQRFPHVRFLKLSATEASQTLSHSLLPAIMVYKAKNLIGNASVKASWSESKNDKFTEEDVEYLLVAKYGVELPGVDISEKEKKNVELEEDDKSSILQQSGAKKVLGRFQ